MINPFDTSTTMKDHLSFFREILITGICIMLFCTCNRHNEWLPEPKIKAGIAKISGKIILSSSGKDTEIPFVELRFPNPVTAGTARFETMVNPDGSFVFEVPVECSVIGSIIPYYVGVCLMPDEETKIEIFTAEGDDLKINMESRFGLTSEDMLNLTDRKMWKTFYQWGKTTLTKLYTMKPEDFVQIRIEEMERRIKDAMAHLTLSKRVERHILNECRTIFLDAALLDYKECILSDYRRKKGAEEPDEFIPQDPGKSYYTFLNYFNLNDPHYLYTGHYHIVLQTILSLEALGIPAIGDTPINEWLKVVKNTMAPLIGSDTGLFYEMLAANAYARQFNTQQKPLSEKQQENITSYFKNRNITQILLTKNKEIVKLYKENQAYFSLNINETPTVPKEALMNTIVSKHKGKVVFVDFWATWCAPCIEAMEEFRAVKSELKGRDIVYLYIASPSSPQKLWREKIETIRGEHYYLTWEEWEYLMEGFDFEAIPSYLLFDTTGKLKLQRTAYPGNREMKAKIEELLL